MANRKVAVKHFTPARTCRISFESPSCEDLDSSRRYFGHNSDTASEFINAYGLFLPHTGCVIQCVLPCCDALQTRHRPIKSNVSASNPRLCAVRVTNQGAATARRIDSMQRDMSPLRRGYLARIATFRSKHAYSPCHYPPHNSSVR